MKVAVVMGGASPEHQVSLASGKGIIKAVEQLGHTAIPLLIDAEGNWSDGSTRRSRSCKRATSPSLLCTERAVRTARCRASSSN